MLWNTPMSNTLFRHECVCMCEREHNIDHTYDIIILYYPSHVITIIWALVVAGIGRCNEAIRLHNI